MKKWILTIYNSENVISYKSLIEAEIEFEAEKIARQTIANYPKYNDDWDWTLMSYEWWTEANKNKVLTFKKKKETEKELAHVDVYHNNIFIGYYIKNKNPLGRLNENWNFVSKVNYIPNGLYNRTKELLIEDIKPFLR